MAEGIVTVYCRIIRRKTKSVFKKMQKGLRLFQSLKFWEINVGKS